MAQLTAYRAACRRIAAELRTHPERSTFKRDPDYRAIVGNDSRGRAVTAAFLHHLTQHQHIRQLASRVAANDRYGAPVTHRIHGLQWSAGSLRFLQVADEIGKAPAVIEIGGGYGGQRVLCRDIADYTIIDLPEALDVARAYLSLHGMSATFLEPEQVADLEVKPGTFCLSDYALSELPDDVIDSYVQRVVSKCARGRMTCRSFQQAALAERLSQFAGVTMTPEWPRTSRHDNTVIRFESKSIANLVVKITADIADFEQKMSNAERSLSRVGSHLESIGSRLTKGLTLPLVAGIGLAAKAASDFESAFDTDKDSPC